MGMYIPHDMISHIGKIFQGEYNIGYNKQSPIILDIGANVGGFAVWASYRWPNAQIHCYEPVANTFNLLKINTEYNKNILIYNVAVGKQDGKRFIFYGKNNIGEASFIKGEEQQDNGEEVSVIAASSLPKADIVKIDTEGAETEILSALKIKPDVFLIEYHSSDNRRMTDKILKDYVLFESSMRNYNYGIQKYVNKKLINQ